MAAEVFSGERIANFGDNAAGVPDHDWDKRLPDPEAAEKNRAALADITMKAVQLGNRPPALMEWGPDPRYPQLPEHRYTPDNN